MDDSTLTDSRYRMPGAPGSDSGVAWLRSHVARFSDGTDHQRRRSLAVDLLSNVRPESLRRPGDPVATLAAALGLPRSISRDVGLVAAAYHPHLPQSPDADRAVERLAQVCGGKDERSAAMIGLLVQADTATRAMIAGRRPPVPITRRVAPTGEIVEVDLTDAPFGRGPHACPGEAHALAPVEGASMFACLHREGQPLILPNAWDASSALAFVAAGFGDELADLVRTLCELGVAGINFEDGRGADWSPPPSRAG